MTKEEAIEIIKRNCTEGSQLRDACAMFIPEFRESEDEKIRKMMIQFFTDMKKYGYATSPYSASMFDDDCIAYLEKQKEPLPIPDKFSGVKSLMLQYLQSASNRKDDTEIESDTDLWGRKILDYVWKNDEKRSESGNSEKPNDHTEWSEDERIRKQLVDLFKEERKSITDCITTEYDDTNEEDKNRKEWLDEVVAWLEKRKEQKGVILKEIKDPCVRKYMELDKFTLANMLAERDKTNKEIISAFDNIEKQKEQKSTEMDNEEIELSDFENKLFSAFSDGWQQYLDGEEVDVAQWAKEHSAQLLNAAQQELKPAEWSEDDEKMRKRVIGSLEMIGANTRTDSTSVNYCFPKEIAWLKSLPNRVALSNWKPTEEQMDWLGQAILNSSNATMKNALRSLYEDLKKL